MARYIEEKELREWIKNWFEKNRYYHPYSKSNDIPIPELYDILERMPTADVVEVVRCKECKHSIDDKLFGGLWCQHPTEKHCKRSTYFYCGSGERREDVEIR